MSEPFKSVKVEIQGAEWIQNELLWQTIRFDCFASWKGITKYLQSQLKLFVQIHVWSITFSFYQRSINILEWLKQSSDFNLIENPCMEQMIKVKAKEFSNFNDLDIITQQKSPNYWWKHEKAGKQWLIINLNFSIIHP